MKIVITITEKEKHLLNLLSVIAEVRDENQGGCGTVGDELWGLVQDILASNSKGCVLETNEREVKENGSN